MARMSNHYSSLRTVYEEWINLYNVTREDVSMSFTSKDDITTITFDLTNPCRDRMHFLSAQTARFFDAVSRR